MVKIESTKRKDWSLFFPRSKNLMSWINLVAWLLSILLWMTSSPRQVIIDTAMMETTPASTSLLPETKPRLSVSSTESTTFTTTHQPPPTITTSTPPVFLVQSISTGHHNPHQQRTVLSFTTVPNELSNMVQMVQRICEDRNFDIFDAIHINIPWTPLRFNEENFPSSNEVLDKFRFANAYRGKNDNNQQKQDKQHDPRIIVNRLMDYGPLTRYFGALGFEKHPNTRIIVYDIDSTQVNIDKLKLLIRGVNELDPKAIWCNFGEDFRQNAKQGNQIEPYWGTYESFLSEDKTLSWNLVYFCRGAGGILIQPMHFQHFILNATDYHHSCFWDDDRFISFQMGVLGFERKNIHTAEWFTSNYLHEREQKKKVCQAELAADAAAKSPQLLEQRRRLGTLSVINNKNKPDIHCTSAFLKRHPHLFPLSANATALCPT